MTLRSPARPGLSVAERIRCVRSPARLRPASDETGVSPAHRAGPVLTAIFALGYRPRPSLRAVDSGAPIPTSSAEFVLASDSDLCVLLHTMGERQHFDRRGDGMLRSAAPHPLPLSVALLLCAGCTSAQFTPATLPQDWQASRTFNAQTVDLSRLATPTIQNDLIAAGDVLEISLSAGLVNEDDISRLVRINQDGETFLAGLGNVKLEGLDLEEAEALISSLAVEKGLYHAPNVTVMMKRPKVNQVTVIGAVNEPSTYYLRSGASSLLQALVAAGGLAEDAGTAVRISHQGYWSDSGGSPPIAGQPPGDVALAAHQTGTASNQGRSVRVDLVSATTEGTGGGYHLADGTIVTVERRDPEPIQLQGLVEKPDLYDYPVGKELRLLGAISLAGGVSNPVADKVYIIRSKPDTEEPVLIQASLKKAKHDGAENIRLAPGDVVSVEPTTATVLIDTIRVIGFTIGGSVF